MIKIGLMGAGFIADYYMEALKEVLGQKVDIVFSKDVTGPKSAKEFARKWKIRKGTSSVEEVIKDKSIDLLIIALPNHIHKDVILMAAEENKNMLCTKPLGRNSKEAFDILKAVEESGVFNGYLETDVFNPTNIKIKDIIQGGGIGEVLTIRSRLGHSGPHEEWFSKPGLAGGGVIMDLGCHSIELARFLIGKTIKPIEIFAWGDTLLHNIEAEDNAVLLVKFEGNKLCISETSWSTQGGVDARNEIYGSKGVIFTNATRETSINVFSSKGIGYIIEKSKIDKGWTFPVINETYTFGFNDMMKYFISCLRNNIKPSETFRDGYIVNVIVDAAYESIKSGRWEKIKI